MGGRWAAASAQSESNGGAAVGLLSQRCRGLRQGIEHPRACDGEAHTTHGTPHLFARLQCGKVLQFQCL